MSLDNVVRLQERLRIHDGSSLRAVICSSETGLGSTIVVYGPEAVAEAVRRKKSVLKGTHKITRKGLGEMPKVPSPDMCTVEDASKYGLPDGKVVLVPLLLE